MSASPYGTDIRKQRQLSGKHSLHMVISFQTVATGLTDGWWIGSAGAGLTDWAKRM